MLLTDSKGYYSTMGTTYRAILAALIFGSALLAGPQSFARPAAIQLAQAAGMSPDEAAARVRQQTGGRVLNVQSRSQDGTTVYMVKVLLPDGRVRVVTISSR
jgi:hypothetical protein